MNCSLGSGDCPESTVDFTCVFLYEPMVHDMTVVFVGGEGQGVYLMGETGRQMYFEVGKGVCSEDITAINNKKNKGEKCCCQLIIRCSVKNACTAKKMSVWFYDRFVSRSREPKSGRGLPGYKPLTLLRFLMRMWSFSSSLRLEPHRPFDLTLLLNLSPYFFSFPLFIIPPPLVSLSSSITFIAPSHPSPSLSLCCSAQSKVTPDHRLPLSPTAMMNNAAVLQTDPVFSRGTRRIN